MLSGACAQQRTNLYLENRRTCHFKLFFTIIVEKWRLLVKKIFYKIKVTLFAKIILYIFIVKFCLISQKKNYHSYCWKVEEKFWLLYSKTFFLLCIFIEIQACENKRISGRLKILDTINRKNDLKKYVSFLPKDTKKKF